MRIRKAADRLKPVSAAVGNQPTAAPAEPCDAASHAHHSDGASAHRPAFARAVRVGNFLYIAGTTALSHMSGDYHSRRVPPTIEEQARMTLNNIRTLVEAAGGSMANIFKIVIILKNPSHYTRLNAVRAEYFSDNPPVSTCFQANLMREDILVEMEAVATLE